MQPSRLATPVATIEQLETSGSRLDGVPADLEDSMRFAGARLTQAAGILLRLPQEVVAQAIIVFTRFFAGPEGGSFAEYDAKQISASSLYMIAKISAAPKSPRSIINVYAYLDSFPHTFLDIEEVEKKKDAEEYFVSEGMFQEHKARLFAVEPVILKVLGFQLQVSLPYTLCITYMQALDVFSQPRASELARRAVARLNDMLLSPQLLCLTHQPPCLATAAIYLAAKEVGVQLPDVEWWEVFDTDREELGFLVVGMLSVTSFAIEEKEKWGKRSVPMTVEELDLELSSRRASTGED
ncbi:cyclin-like protein [Clohesyomyces aquaticus]|uniref:Cyclin-like protein n=1 Tax=Clohesyomyces aquaticus TaxID=1231657 RepID=A0A1Y1YGW0_9PLEO|nr:cyclin-like protein [Clohesyomyces aquaticus]